MEKSVHINNAEQTNRQPKQDKTVHIKRTTGRQAQKSAQNRQAQQDPQAGNKAAASKRENPPGRALCADPAGSSGFFRYMMGAYE